jgi:hypothetical protein
MIGKSYMNSLIEILDKNGKENFTADREILFIDSLQNYLIDGNSLKFTVQLLSL